MIVAKVMILCFAMFAFFLSRKNSSPEYSAFSHLGNRAEISPYQGEIGPGNRASSVCGLVRKGPKSCMKGER